MTAVYSGSEKKGYQEFVSEVLNADPLSAYIKVKTENIGYMVRSQRPMNLVE